MPNKNLTPYLAVADRYDPWYNLAVEEYLLEELSEGEIYLYLWQNENTVVIGRNQNAWRECRVEKLRQDGGQLARRLSGGGAVFHDVGNLNYTILMKKRTYDLESQLQVIIKALNDLGVDAEFSGRNDIVCGEKKISGNAFYYGAKGAYIHGTVLVDADLEKLISYLQVSEEKIKSKGIESVKARVMNLTDINNNLTVDQVKNSIRASFRKVYNQGGELPAIEIDYGADRIEQLYDKYSSWDWRFGAAPDCDVSFSNRFSWGEVEFNLNLVDGYIQQAVIYSDAMYGDLIEQVAAALEDLPFETDVILEAVEEVLTNYHFPQAAKEEELAAEFKDWLREELKQII